MNIRSYISITESRLQTDCLSVLVDKILKEMTPIDFPKMTKEDEGYNRAITRLTQVLKGFERF